MTQYRAKEIAVELWTRISGMNENYYNYRVYQWDCGIRDFMFVFLNHMCKDGFIDDNERSIILRSCDCPLCAVFRNNDNHKFGTDCIRCILKECYTEASYFGKVNYADSYESFISASKEMLNKIQSWEID